MSDNKISKLPANRRSMTSICIDSSAVANAVIQWCHT